MKRLLLVLAAAVLVTACGGVERAAQVEQLEQACRSVQKVCICHVPPGNPENAHEICISERAWSAHKRNHKLDYIGACDEKCYQTIEICWVERVKECGECSCTIEYVKKCKDVVVEVPCEPEDPRCDAGTSCDEDAAVPEQDASVPEPDAYVPEPDQSVPEPDAGDECDEDDCECLGTCTEPDAGVEEDAGEPEADAGCDENDCECTNTCLEPDAGVTEEDASTPGVVDAGTPNVRPDSSVNSPVDPPVTSVDPPVTPQEVLLAGGGGCAMSGQTVTNNYLGTGLIALLGILFMLATNRRRAAVLLSIIAVVLLSSGVVYAGPNAFSSAAGSGDFITTRSAVLSKPTVGFTYDYAHRPLRVVLPGRGDTVYNVIDGQHNFNLTGALSIYDRVELGVALPFTIYQHEGNLAPLGLTDLSAGLGDIKLLTKVRLYTYKTWTFSLGHELGLPTSKLTTQLGEGGVTFEPEALVTWSGDRVQVGGSLGVKIRPLDQSFSFGAQNLSIDEQFNVGIATRVRVWNNEKYQVNALGDIQLSLGIQELNEEEAPLEALVGGEVNLPYNLTAQAGIGVGLTRGLNTPVVRPFIGLAWTWETVKPAPCEPVIVEVPKVVEKKKLVPVPVPVPVPVAVVLSIPTVYFDTDKADLRPEGVRKLEWLVKQLKRHPEVKTVRIEGHTDHRASDKYNQALSERRVQTCVDFLADSGISLERLDARAYGETQRVDTTETDEGMQLNRRVEFTVTKVDRP